MLSGGFQSNAYKQLLARQKEEDDERQVKLEELRKKKLREDIKRKRDEEDARKKIQRLKEQKEQELKQAKLDQEKAERKQVLKKEEEERKRPLTVGEAKQRREKAEAARNANGISRPKQVLASSSKVMSTKYSSLLATAPSKLDTITPSARKKISGTGQVNGSQKPVLAQIAKRISSPVKSSASDRVKVAGPVTKALPDITERRTAPYLNSKIVSSSSRKHIPPEVANLQPLQKTKRDLRTIEEIQNDLHRRNGKDYAYLSQPKAVSPMKKAASSQIRPAAPIETLNQSSKTKASSSSNSLRHRETKRSRRDSYDSDDSFVSRDAPPSSRRDNGLGGESIWDILNPGKKRDAYLARDIDSDEDMEANAEDIRREEQRATKAAKLEDEREAALLREKEERKAAAKKRKLAS